VKDLQYQSLRENLFILTATCSEPSATCFCTSMGHGPRAEEYDINLTEIYSADEHFFVAQAGTNLGSRILSLLVSNRSELDEISKSEAVYQAARTKITRTMDTKNLQQLLANNMDHSQWELVADRCLSCGNCTMVCPTCFCTTTYDINDLEGDNSERWLRWDSCFTADFSYIHGGPVRSSTKSRYRQWLTHKLSTWHEQFGNSGCVGCGRCVAWCPVSIDITEEVKALRTPS
jgi:ferredoxin